MIELVHLTIRGCCVSLKNSRDIAVNRRTGRMWPKKNAAILKFEADFAAQVPPKARVGLRGPLAVTTDVWYPDERQDLDCAILYDLLQSTGIIGNDRQIREKHETRHTDKDNPRISLIVRRLQ